MTRRLAITASAVFGYLALTAPAHAQDSVGVNAAIRNSVQTRSASASALRPAQLRAPVRLGDQFVTGAQSHVQVLLRDRSTFTVGPNARMTVDSFVVSAGGGGAVTVARGAFRFVSGRNTRSSSRNAISTPVASIGVRGTVVEGLVGPELLEILRSHPGVPAFTGDPETMLLVVLRGPSGRAETLDTPGAIDVVREGVTVELSRPGQALLVTSDGVFGPFFLPDEVSAALANQLSPAPSNVTDPGGDQTEFSAGIAADDTTVSFETLLEDDAGIILEPLPREDDLQLEFPFFPPPQPMF